MKNLFCCICKIKTMHKLVCTVGVLTKYRTVTKKTYQCPVCDNLKVTITARKKKNVRLLD